MPLPLHQIAPADLTPEQVLSTIALIDGECSFAQAEMIAEAVNCQRGNLQRACPGWHQSYHTPFLAYAQALLCERDPAELGAWLITCAQDAEARASSHFRTGTDTGLELAAEWRAKAAAYRRREAEIAVPAVASALRASLAVSA